MKRITIVVVLLSFSICSFCQQKLTNDSMTREAFLIKSKKQKSEAMGLLIAGGVVTVIGGIIAGSGQGDVDMLFTNEDQGTIAAGSIVMLVGGVAMLGSIPIFIAAERNKKNAMNASAYFKMEKLKLPQQLNRFNHSYPAIAIQINF